ncbi:MAG: SDR family NAD(P)-dependent oxidoreductase, partial [Sediminibacterium sp.]|nr:SDR family NAD(P)-dependent oxidoreductase [Sediminibacterium sp.]
QTYFFIADLADALESEKVCCEIKNNIGIPDIIINNAGGGQFKTMKQAHISDAVKAMGAPYFSSYHLTCFFFNDFCTRNTGCLLFVNTPAAYFPFPYTLTYSSTRWALRAMIRCLRLELKNTNILVTEVIPGLTASNYFANNNMPEDQHIPTINSYLFKKLSSEEVASSIYKGISKGKKLIVPQKLMHLILPLSQIFPKLFDKLLMWKKNK